LRQTISRSPGRIRSIDPSLPGLTDGRPVERPVIGWASARAAFAGPAVCRDDGGGLNGLLTILR
jgi:hypothetical protein